MKKKVKLFTTIASLCLAVALMAFGVYAATNASFNITNKVSFTAAANVKAKVWHTLAVGKCEQKGALAAASEAAPDLKFNGGEEGGVAQTIELGDVVLTAASGSVEQMTYSYTITIKNTALVTDSNPYLKVEITGKTVAYTADAGYSIATAYGEDKTETEVLGAGETKVYTVTITVDNSHSISNVDLGTSVKLTAQATKA